MSSERVRILLIMLVAVLVLAVGEILLAKGMRQAGRAPRGWTGEVIAAVRSGWVWAGLALLVVHVGLYMAALSAADLSFVLPLTAASYPLAAFLSKFYLHEQVNLTRWVGTLIITVGVAIVAVGEGADRESGFGGSPPHPNPLPGGEGTSRIPPSPAGRGPG